MRRIPHFIWIVIEDSLACCCIIIDNNLTQIQNKGRILSKMTSNNNKKEEIATESQPLLVAKKAISIDDDDDFPDAHDVPETILEDAIDILKLGVPIFVSSLSWVGVSDIRILLGLSFMSKSIRSNIFLYFFSMTPNTTIDNNNY